MKYKRVIWDWNGTLLDDFDISIDAINEMFEERGMPKFKDKEDYLKHFCFPIEKYYKNVGFDFSKVVVGTLDAYGANYHGLYLYEFIDKYNQKLVSCGLVKGIREVLEAFKDAGIKQMILSACEQNMLDKDICRFDLGKYFDAVLGGGDIYAKGKVERALEWISDSKTDISDTLFVGDTLHDYDTAKAIGADVLLVTYGHSDRTRLSATGQTVVDTPEEIKDFVFSEK